MDIERHTTSILLSPLNHKLPSVRRFMWEENIHADTPTQTRSNTTSMDNMAQNSNDENEEEGVDDNDYDDNSNNDYGNNNSNNNNIIIIIVMSVIIG